MNGTPQSRNFERSSSFRNMKPVVQTSLGYPTGTLNKRELLRLLSALKSSCFVTRKAVPDLVIFGYVNSATIVNVSFCVHITRSQANSFAVNVCMPHDDSLCQAIFLSRRWDCCLPLLVLCWSSIVGAVSQRPRRPTPTWPVLFSPQGETTVSSYSSTMTFEEWTLRCITLHHLGNWLSLASLSYIPKTAVM